MPNRPLRGGGRGGFKGGVRGVCALYDEMAIQGERSQNTRQTLETDTLAPSGLICQTHFQAVIIMMCTSAMPFPYGMRWALHNRL